MTSAELPSEHSVGLVYEEIRDHLSRQERTLDEARSRAGTLLAVTALVLGFFGEAILTANGEPSAVFWLGLLTMVIGLGLALWVMSPKKDWLFSSSPSDLLEHYIDLPAATSKRYLSRYMAGWVAENGVKLKKAHLAIFWSIVYTVAGLIILLVDFAGAI